MSKLKDDRSQFRDLNWTAVACLILIGSFAYCLAPKSASGYIIGSITALLVAFVAYPWQKKRDRELKLGEERRSSYRRFIEKCTSARDLIASARSELKINLLKGGEGQSLEQFVAVFDKIGRYNEGIRNEYALFALSATNAAVDKAGEIIGVYANVSLNDIEEMREVSDSSMPLRTANEALIKYFDRIIGQTDEKVGSLIHFMRDAEFGSEASEKHRK
ncbi:hypothetical protein [Primorskyibacter flagellatus]|uniref:hypothetical protein n=1 Tax=Primorskyibacter flagellatus TaxID=1387277 RepID=UPI003A8FD8B2